MTLNPDALDIQISIKEQRCAQLEQEIAELHKEQRESLDRLIKIINYAYERKKQRGELGQTIGNRIEILSKELNDLKRQ